MYSTIEKKLRRRDFMSRTVKACLQAGVLPALMGCGERDTVMAQSEMPATGMSSDFEPAYLKLHESGELAERADELWNTMKNCRLCPRQCGAERIDGESGFCQAPGTGLIVSSFHAHYGEERPLVGSGGSGTIFFSHCSLRCVFCQNYTISHLGRGSRVSVEELAGMMLRQQQRGCHNINVVTPTHYSAHILKAIDIAAGRGLRLPIVYNTSGWERIEVVKLLDGIVDIYLPDIKFWDDEFGDKYFAGADRYPDAARETILEMHRQVGVAHPNRYGVMERGLMIRHLVMPNEVSGSEKVMRWIADELPKDTYVNIMAQYTPSHKAFDHPAISRRITGSEYRTVVRKAEDLGLSNLDVRAYWWMRG